MVEWSQLLAPIALSAAGVFVLSSLIHMVLKWHNREYRRLSNEDAVAAALRDGGVTPGQYVFPHCLDPKDAALPEMAAKFAEGPVGILYVRPSGMTKLGPFLGKWVVYTVVVSAVVAYVGRAELRAGADYLAVFQLIGVATWLAYSFQGGADSIWKGKPWVITAKEMADGLVYALFTAGAFAWLWPR